MELYPRVVVTHVSFVIVSFGALAIPVWFMELKPF